MQSPSLNAYADYETKILPISRASWQTLLITNGQSRENSLIVITTNIFDSALEYERSKGCRVSQIFAQNTECFQSEPASLAWCKKLHRNRATRFCDACRKLTLLVGQTEIEIVKLPA
jgi:hypothetical protein